MTDVSPGPGWWLASDGHWYPPHLHPDVRARADVVVDDAPTANGATASNGATHAWDTPAADAPVEQPEFRPPTVAVPDREPIDWARVAEERAARRKANEARSYRKYVGAGIVTLAALGAFWLIARNDNDGDISDQTEGDGESAVTSTTVAPVTSTTLPAVTTTVVPGTVSVFALQPGTCVQNADLLSGRVTTVVEVSCDQPHTHEVYHKVTFTPPDGTFDEARISAFASEQCTQSFATYVGVPFDRSKYYYVQFAPTQESWTQQGDRDVMCLLFLQGSELTGSAKGTAQ
jgi:hypothetical protein